VVDRYLEAHPDLREKYERHIEIERETREPSAGQMLAGLMNPGTLPPRRPEELRDYQDNLRSELQNLVGGERHKDANMSEVFGGGDDE